MTTATKREWLTTRQAAEMMGIAYQTLCNWRASKDPRRPKAHYSGKKVRYRASVIQRWIDENAED